MLTDNLYNRTTTIQMHDGRRIIVLPTGETVEIGDEKFSSGSTTKHNSSDAGKIIPKNVTGINSGDAEILDKKNLTDIDTETFSNDELLILEQIQNA